MKEQIEVATDSANSGMRIRSTGSSGEVCAICRATSTTPADQRAAAISHDTLHGSLAVPDAVDRGDQQAEGDRVPAARSAGRSGCRASGCLRQGAQRRSSKASAPVGTFTANSHGQGATERMPAATVGPSAEDDRADHRVDADAAAEPAARVDEAHQRAVDAHDRRRRRSPARRARCVSVSSDRDSAQPSEATVKTISPH